MKLRMVQWNISTMSRPKAIADFIKKRTGEGPAIVCLEEVKRSSYEKLVGFLNPMSSCFSLDLRPSGQDESKARRLGVAMLAFGLRVHHPKLVGRAVFPERTLSALIDGIPGSIRIVAFHSLTGVGYGELKAKNFASIANYLRRHRDDVDFLCFDANEPNHDSMDLDKLVFSPRDKGTVKKAALIMGPEKVHDLTDSYVDDLRRKKRHVTTDPLTASYKTGTPGKKQVEKRYDYIMHSRRWQVTRCTYPYDKSVAATSDHSAVVADYELM